MERNEQGEGIELANELGMRKEKGERSLRKE